MVAPDGDASRDGSVGASSSRSTLAVGYTSGAVATWYVRAARGDAAPAIDPGPEIPAPDDGAAITALEWTTSANGGTYLVVGDARGRARLWRRVEDADDAGGGAGSAGAARFLPAREIAASASRDPIVALAVDRLDRLGRRVLALGRASGAVDVVDLFPAEDNGAEEKGAEEKGVGDESRGRIVAGVRARVAPVAGVAWCAFPDNRDGRRRSALVATFADGHSATIVVDGTPRELRVVRDDSSPPPPRNSAVVPVDFHAGLAASPSGLYLARAFAFANPAMLNASNAAVIAARARRGAVVVEAARAFAGDGVFGATTTTTTAGGFELDENRRRGSVLARGGDDVDGGVGVGRSRGDARGGGGGDARDGASREHVSRRADGDARARRRRGRSRSRSLSRSRFRSRSQPGVRGMRRGRRGWGGVLDVRYPSQTAGHGGHGTRERHGVTTTTFRRESGGTRRRESGGTR